MEKSHAISRSSKRKGEFVEKENQEVQDSEVNSQDMEFDVIIEELDWTKQWLVESTIAKEPACEEPIVFEEE